MGLQRHRDLVLQQVVRVSVVVKTSMRYLFLEPVSNRFQEIRYRDASRSSLIAPIQRLENPDNIVLIEQPPYCLELNPLEQTGTEVRETCLANRLLKTIDAWEGLLAYALKDISKYGEKLRSLTFSAYQRSNTTCSLVLIYYDENPKPKW